jgi:hypothetical protein
MWSAPLEPSDPTATTASPAMVRRRDGDATGISIADGSKLRSNSHKAMENQSFLCDFPQFSV